MDDDSVEYINIEDIISLKKYKIKGKINDLNDIVNFDILSVKENEGGVYITTIAIDKDGNYYDINEMI